MPATPARIGLISSEYRKVISLTATASTKHGGMARESDDPIETFFDNAADAQVVADARQDLLSAERRRFKVTVTGLDEVMALTYVGAVPVGYLTDLERNISRPVLVSDITMDFDKQSASLTVWG